MIRRLVVAATVVLTAGFAATAYAEGEVVEGAPAPAAALAAPAPEAAPPVTGQVDTAGVAKATRELSWGGVGVRLGYFNLAAKAKDVPLVGDDVMKYRKEANEFVAAYNQAIAQHPELGLQPMKEYGEDAIDLEANLIQVIPTFHMGGDGYFFKLELPIGFGDGVTSFGLGLYPINYGYFIESIGLFPYVSAGTVLNAAMASTYSGPNGDVDVSQVGGIIQGRVALGAKYAFAESFSGTLELGFTPWGIAGLVDTEKADKVEKQGGLAPDDLIDLETMRPIDPGSAGRAGQISSAFDFSVGLEWI